MDQTQLKHDIETHLATLKTLRDEVRVKLHLAGMDAKKAFEEVETEASRLSHEISEASKHALVQVTDRLKHLASSIRGEETVKGKLDTSGDESTKA